MKQVGAYFWNVLIAIDQLGNAPHTLVAGPEVDSNAVFAPKGDRIAFVRGTPDPHMIMTVRSDGSDVTQVAPVDHGRVRLAWAADGSALFATVASQKPLRA